MLSPVKKGKQKANSDGTLGEKQFRINTRQLAADFHVL